MLKCMGAWFDVKNAFVHDLMLKMHACIIWFLKCMRAWLMFKMHGCMIWCSKCMGASFSWIKIKYHNARSSVLSLWLTNGPLIQKRNIIGPLLRCKPVHEALINFGRSPQHIEIFRNNGKNIRALDFDRYPLASHAPGFVHLFGLVYIYISLCVCMYYSRTLKLAAMCMYVCTYLCIYVLVHLWFVCPDCVCVHAWCIYVNMRIWTILCVRVCLY